MDISNSLAFIYPTVKTNMRADLIGHRILTIVFIIFLQLSTYIHTSKDKYRSNVTNQNYFLKQGFSIIKGGLLGYTSLTDRPILYLSM